MEIEINYGFQAVNFTHKTKASQDKGEKLYKAGHVYSVKEKKYADISSISAKVIRQTSINKEPYTVELKVEKNRDVSEAICNCIAGVAGYCKHISAVVFFVNCEFSASKTSSNNEWQAAIVKTKKAATEKYSKGRKISELYPKPSSSREKQEDYVPHEITAADLENIPCALLNMLRAQESDGVVQDAVAEDINSVVESTSSISFNEIFIHQKLSMFLRPLFKGPSFNSECCRVTYENYIICDKLKICLETLSKENWHQARQFRITASRCYSLYTYVCNTHSEEEWISKIEKYFWSSSFSNKYTEHGIENEPPAREAYKRQNNVDILETGLITCDEAPWIACSPDGIVMKSNRPHRLLEIKCPFEGKNAPLATILSKCTYLRYDKSGHCTLRKKHQYYAQVQVNMALLNLEMCDFVIYAPFDRNFATIPVFFDRDFCTDLFIKLEQLYFGKMLHFICKKRIAN